ncbi:MAG TPA: response regulator [Candidatus Acidoferrum sp.]|jgi:two-component system response regulator DevR|nr:response regulator [Candidatus Acidoferrum sp.]
MAIRVLIADDSDVMRAAIARTLQTDPALEVVGEAASFAETLERAGTLNPDIVLLDLHMSDEFRYSPEIVKGPLLENSGCILAISMWNDEDAKALAKRLGAVTLLDKAHLFSNLISSIKMYCTKD